MAAKKKIGIYSDLRRWRKLHHGKPLHRAFLTYKVKAITSKRIRLDSLFKALPHHCPAYYEVLDRTLNLHPPAYET